MSFITTQWDGIRDRFERLSQRERTMVGALGVSMVVMIVLIVGALIGNGLSTMSQRNADMRQALSDIATHRDSYLRSKAKMAQLEARLGRTPVALQSYLEQAAKATGVEIPESNDNPPVAVGKHYTERSVDLRLRQVSLDSLARFMRKIETGPGIVEVTALNIRSRDDKHEDFDVAMTVSTYERAQEKKDKSTANHGDKT